MWSWRLPWGVRGLPARAAASPPACAESAAGTGRVPGAATVLGTSAETPLCPGLAGLRTGEQPGEAAAVGREGWVRCSREARAEG